MAKVVFRWLRSTFEHWLGWWKKCFQPCDKNDDEEEDNNNSDRTAKQVRRHNHYLKRKRRKKKEEYPKVATVQQ